MISAKLGGISNAYERAIQCGIAWGKEHLEELPSVEKYEKNPNIVNQFRRKFFDHVSLVCKYDLSMAQSYAILNACYYIKLHGFERFLFAHQKNGLVIYEEKNGEPILIEAL